jgi:hypothetical protein
MARRPFPITILLASLCVTGLSIVSGSFAHSEAFFIVRLLLLILGLAGLTTSLFLAFKEKNQVPKIQSRRKPKAGIRTLIEEGDTLLVDLNETKQVSIVRVEPTEKQSPLDNNFILVYENPEMKLKFESDPVSIEESELISKIQRWGHTQIFVDKENPEHYYFDTEFLTDKKSIH